MNESKTSAYGDTTIASGARLHDCSEIEPDCLLAHASKSHVPTGAPRRTGRRVLCISAALVLALTTIFMFRYVSNAREEALLLADVQRAANEPVSVDVIHVKLGTPQETLTLPGEARPFREATVFARTSGYVSKWTKDAEGKDIKWVFDIGDAVKEGQIIATLETPELNDQIAAAKANVNRLTAQVKVAETSTSFARLSFDRWEAASRGGAISVQERDQKKSELDASLAKLDAAKAEVAVAQAELGRLQTMNKFREVRAPFDGMITSREVDVGDLVSAGSTSNTMPLFTIAQSDLMRVWVDVPQALASKINRRMAAVVMYGGREFSGQVDRRAESINLASRTLKVEVRVVNQTHELLPGTYLQVKFKLDRDRPPLQIPASALAWRTTGPMAAVVDEQGLVKFVAVTILRDMGDLVEVDGLMLNQRVALNIGSQVPDGGRVSAHDVDSPAQVNAATTSSSLDIDAGRNLMHSH